MAALERVTAAADSRMITGAFILVIGGIGGLAVVRFDPLYVILAAVILLLIVISPTVSEQALLVMLGMLLPIWSVGSLPNNLFDMARYGVTLLLIGRLAKNPPIDRPGFALNWAMPMLGLGAFVTMMSFVQSDKGTLTIGYTTFAGAAVAWVIIRRVENFWPLLLGFLVGVTASAVVMILAKNGYTALTPQKDAGYFRLTGLAPSAPKAGYEMAFGVLIAAVMAATTKRLRVQALGVVVAATCLFGLLICGGRGGLIGLGVATLFAVLHGWIKLPLAVLAGAGVWFATTRLSVAVESLNTVSRLGDADPNKQAGFSTGRLDAAKAAFTEVKGDPLGLRGFDNYFATHTVTAHTPILAFAATAGIAAGVVVLILSIRLFVLAIHKPRSTRPEAYVASLFLCVMATEIALEPDGPFVGLEAITLLFVAVCAVTRSPDRLELDRTEALASARTP